MVSIIEPRKYIIDLWNRVERTDGIVFRLMKYVLKVDYNDKVLLHNAVTGQLIVLNQEELNLLNDIPCNYNHSMKQLIDCHYLVPNDFDEHQLVLNIRYVLRKLELVHNSGDITRFTILPTTACNARCYYCFEQGAKNITMTEHTANEVVDFISKQCGDKYTAHITWFGGEPTVASNRIDQISEGLKKNKIQFYSDMTTNGYLFDEEMVHKAKTLWNLEYLQICFDGLESRHNQIKNYAKANDNPFQRTLRNISLLLDQGIRVGMRMNFDKSNYFDFEELVKEAVKRYGQNPNLSVYAFPVIGEYRNQDGVLLHGSVEWFQEKIAELNEISRNAHTYHERQILPYLKFHCCDAENRNAITITAKGTLVRCCECFGDENEIGTIKEGITDLEGYYSWEQSADYVKCKDCIYFPYCFRITKCPGNDRCQFYKEWCSRNVRTIRETYCHRMLQNSKE